MQVGVVLPLDGAAPGLQGRRGLRAVCAVHVPPQSTPTPLLLSLLRPWPGLPFLGAIVAGAGRKTLRQEDPGAGRKTSFRGHMMGLRIL